MTATSPTDAAEPDRVAGAPTSAPAPTSGWVPAGGALGDSGGLPARSDGGPLDAPNDAGEPDRHGAGGAGVASPPEAGSQANTAAPPAPAAIPKQHKVEPTRTSGLWTAVVAASVLLLILIVFIAQNSHQVNIHFLWLTGDFSLGLALLVAAVIGALTVATVGVARTMQLRRTASRHRNADALASAPAAPVPGTPSPAGGDAAGTDSGTLGSLPAPTSGTTVAARPAAPARKAAFWRRSK